MAPNHYKGLLRKVLSGFITEQDPVLTTPEWVAHQMMLIEAEVRVGAGNEFYSRLLCSKVGDGKFFQVRYILSDQYLNGFLA